MKVVSIVGARPQFIKCAALSKALRSKAEEILVHTGQHYDENMNEVFFRELGIPRPDHYLEVGSGPHGAQTGLILERVEKVLTLERPDMVVVFGDTNSTLGGALAAAKMRLPVGHVEAGLRSGRAFMAEEINRVLTDRISSLLFCSSDRARRNLEAEGLSAGVHVVGDIMYDVLLSTLPTLDVSPRGKPNDPNPVPYAVATLHRAENTDDPAPLKSIMQALDSIAEKIMPVLLPLHPRTVKMLAEFGIRLGSVRGIEPKGYKEMLSLMRSAKVILTDSGGMQKEAFWLGVPCVTLRDETEWVETVEAGWNRLVGSSTEKIIQAATEASPPPGSRRSLYGDGRAAEKIVSLICDRIW